MSSNAFYSIDILESRVYVCVCVSVCVSVFLRVCVSACVCV